MDEKFPSFGLKLDSNSNVEKTIKMVIILQFLENDRWF